MNTDISRNGLAKVLHYHEDQVVSHINSLFKTAADFKEYTPVVHILEHIAIMSYHKLGELYELKSHQNNAKTNLHYSDLCYQRVQQFCCNFLKNHEENSLFKDRKDNTE